MIAVPADGRPGRAMFLTSLTPRFWTREEARARGGSLAIAVLAHAVILALLLRVGAGRSPAPSEETTTWLLIGPPGPGGGVVPLAEPGAAEPEEATPEEPDVEEVVEDFPEEPIAEIEAVAPSVVPDSLPTVATGAAVASGGGVLAPGVVAGAGGGAGGGFGGGTTGGIGGGSGGRGTVRPLHLVVPRIPPEVDARRARGSVVRLLLEVLPDGTVGSVRVEDGTAIAALDSAAVDAARRLRYSPPSAEGITTPVWTRAAMRF